MIAIIDYGVGNLKSIFRATSLFTQGVKLLTEAQDLKQYKGVIIPGVGAFPTCKKLIVNKGFDRVITEAANSAIPIFGICIGMQLLFDYSEEFGYTEGLGLIPGKVTKIQTIGKLPHIAWNEIILKHDRYFLLKNIDNLSNMYFVHSYAAIPDDTQYILTETILSDTRFCSTISQNNIMGCQYHPEKSGQKGLSLIKNFVTICMGEADDS